MNWLNTQLVSAFLLPPLCFLLFGLAGLFLWRRRPVAARRLVAFSMGLLWAFSMPLTGDTLLGLLESRALLADAARPGAQAIVVLGGGTNFDAPEFGGDTVNSATLERLRYAAALQRSSGLPLLVTGGDPRGRGVAEATLMAQVLKDEFGVPVRWVEAASDNTIQNAAYSRKLLADAGISTILLVTQGWHMPRGKMLFERAGLDVRPAGTGFQGRHRLTVLDFLPSSEGLRDSRIFFHEAIGLMWASLRPVV